ncbi:MAG: hypothetical protein JWO20_3070 [Candidatus Angelobacter sp.]|jgi:hypothetical protein|nr:hypothetical protein [Candidatus Angelobacter sp.]
MAFEQASIAIQSTEFEQLKDLISKALGKDNVSKFMKSISSDGLLVRQIEEILNRGLLNKVVSGSASALELYKKMPASDQGQLREFYLTRIEEVDIEIRRKFQKIYAYS